MEVAMSPELRAKIDAIEAKYGGGPKEYRQAVRAQAARPKVVVESGKVVAEAEVRVSEADPNWRPKGWVTVNLEAADRQFQANEAQRRADAAHREWLDPYSLGHWGPRR
jgi:hypothetical protein